MTRRLSRLAVATAAVSLMATASAVTGLSAAQAAPATPTRVAAGGWWFCVANQQLDVGYCQGDPVPPVGPIYVP